EEAEEEHDLVVVDLSEGGAEKDAPPQPAAVAASQHEGRQDEREVVMDDVAGFSVGEGAVLTEAERNVRTAQALAKAAAMHELSSALFPLLVELLPEVLGQEAAAEDPSAATVAAGGG
ncbi:unnamed protein product, partial [Ectocarpus sp. 13 AM-2016]